MYIVASNGNEEISGVATDSDARPEVYDPHRVAFLTPDRPPGLSIWNTVFVGTIVAVSQVVFLGAGWFRFLQNPIPKAVVFYSLVIGTMMLPRPVGHHRAVYVIVYQSDGAAAWSAIIVPALVTAFGALLDAPDHRRSDYQTSFFAGRQHRRRRGASSVFRSASFANHRAEQFRAWALCFLGHLERLLVAFAGFERPEPVHGFRWR
jgi:hypothetical protein